MGPIQEYSDVHVFALTDSELGYTGIVRHSTQRNTTRQMVEQMQRQGIVQSSRSTWASPVILVAKKDGSVRFCVGLMRLQKKMCFPSHEWIDTLAGTQFFTSLDLASGYWQIGPDDDAHAKSAFTTYIGLFEFVQMPFRL